MNAHTPGPWDRRIEYNLLKDEIGVRGKAICSTWVRRFDGTLTDERRIVRDPEGEANARLISAAPDLLSELQSIVARIDAEGGSPTFHARDLDGARAAIKKAIGHE